MIAVDDYVFDTLMRDLVGHDRQPSAYLVYLCLWRERHRAGGDPVQLSLQELAGRTGLSKRAVQDAISRLHRRKLIGIKRAGITAIPEYSVRTPWRREKGD
ncbi:MAG TPA: helix-turn-helix domain-containing protein [Gemmatimonadaceae bacterium]